MKYDSCLSFRVLCQLWNEERVANVTGYWVKRAGDIDTRVGSQRNILIPLYMAVTAASTTTAMICTAWSQTRVLCGLLGIPSPLMFVSRLPSVSNPKAPINMLDTSRSFQKVWSFKAFTWTHYSEAGIIPSRERGLILDTYKSWYSKYVKYQTGSETGTPISGFFVKAKWRKEYGGKRKRSVVKIYSPPAKNDKLIENNRVIICYK